MARALYHVMSRGDWSEAIYEVDADREAFLDLLATYGEQYNWICHAYCSYIDGMHIPAHCEHPF